MTPAVARTSVQLSPFHRLARFGRAARRVGSVLALAAGSVAVATQAGAATPHDQFLKDLERIAPFPPAKAKRLCRCTTTDRVGEVRPDYRYSEGLTTTYKLVCSVPVFDALGSISYTMLCPEGQFEILEK